MDKFIGRLVFNLHTNQQILKLIGAVDGFNGKWSVFEKGKNLHLRNFEEEGIIKTIGSSARLEGTIISDSEVKALIKSNKDKTPQTITEHKVFFLFKALKQITESYPKFQLDLNNINSLYQQLTKRESEKENQGADYNDRSNEINADIIVREQKPIYSITPPALIEPKIRELIEWTNDQFEQQIIHPLIIIGSFTYDFLSIRPFNFRTETIASLLITLCSLQNNYRFVKGISFISYVEKHEKDFRDSIINGQKSRVVGTERIDKWLIFFLGALYELCKELDEKLENFGEKGSYLNPRQKRMKTYIERNQPLKVSDLANRFPEIQLSTLKKDLQILRRQQEVIMIGKAKGSIYLTKQ